LPAISFKTQTSQKIYLPLEPKVGAKRKFESEYSKDDEAIWSKKKAKSPLRKFHQVIKDNDLDTLKSMLASDDIKKLVNRQDTHGNTALHIAASIGALRLMEALLTVGANPWALDNEGLTPAFQAAAGNHPSAVKSLISAMGEQPQIEGFWYAPENVAAKLAVASQTPLKKKSAREKLVDDVVTDLTGVDLEDLRDRSELYKYISHLNSWVGETLGEKDEGWYFDRVLIQRIRSLCHILIENTTVPKKARSQMTEQQTEDLLHRELASMLTTLRSARRMSCLHGLRDEAAAISLNHHESIQTLGRIVSMPAGYDCTLPIGFPGHAIYMGIEKRQEDGNTALVFHINNLGAGHRKTHDDNKLGQVWPRAFKVPLDENFQQLAPKLQNFFLQVFNCRNVLRSADWETLYGAITNFQYEIKAIFGPKATSVDANEEGWQAMKAQTAGNCALKNHSASMVTRLGKPLFRWIKSQEKSYAMGRSRNLVSKDLYKEKELEKEKALLMRLINSNQLGIESLKAYLSKPRLKGIGVDIPEHKLLQMIRNDESQVLESLIKLQAKFKTKDDDKNSMLHYATRTGAKGCAQVLIEAGIRVNAKNSCGRTALHYAMENRDHDLIAILIEAGANQDIKDADGQSPQDIFNNKVKEDDKLRDLISRGALKA